MTLLELGYNYVILAALAPVCWYIIQDIESNHLHAWFIKGAAIFLGIFSRFFLDFFPFLGFDGFDWYLQRFAAKPYLFVASPRSTVKNHPLILLYILEGFLAPYSTTPSMPYLYI